MLGDLNGVYLDATFGRGGHSRALLERLGPNARLIACDRDPEAIAWGRNRFAAEPRLQLQHSDFAELDLADDLQAALLDLGVSSPQLDDPERGFSFQRSGPVDMRMNPRNGLSAFDWLQQASERELADTLYYYGEERYSRRIARALKSQSLVDDTRWLAAAIAQAQPRWDAGKHPATRSFQALRIVVNDELGQLQRGLERLWQSLLPGGKLLVICFHSLEARVVKSFLRAQPTARLLSKIAPSAAEQRANPRARSALLRVLFKEA